MAGKGDCPRPLSISYEEYVRRWNMIFGEKKEETKQQDEKS